LLTATAIFAGLLFYANQYGFAPQQDSIAGNQHNAVEQLENAENSQIPDQVPGTQASTTEVAADDRRTATATGLVAMPNGIFNTPTITQTEPESEVLSDNLEQEQLAAIASAIESASPDNRPQANAKTPLAPAVALYQPAATIAAPLVYSYPDSEGFDAWNYANAQYNGAGYYGGLNRGQGRGRSAGRGKADGEGEFSLSMKFRSRARMDADVDADTDFAADSAANHYYGHYQAAHYQPYFNYYSYRGY
jgi:hypothetical protein